MIKLRVLQRAVMCVTFFAMTLICGGCNDNKPLTEDGGGGPRVSFTGRKCPSSPHSETYEIQVVATDQVFKNPSDTDIVVCGGDKIVWSIQSATGVMKIDFVDANANELFEHGNTSVQSHAGKTDEMTVKSPTHGVNIYKYNIVVEDPAGNKKGEKDPHVIPM
jgi:hypothetical protein